METFVFQATIDIIGINPFVFVPGEILNELFRQAGKDKGGIPIKGAINDIPYTQTLIKYSGHWRLYINTAMLKNSPKRIGETVAVSVIYDPESRAIQPPALFTEALAKHPEAKAVFDCLPPSRRLEIVRYLAKLKSGEALEKNVDRAINFLLGKERFIGRDKP